ncbi:MAG: dTDP-4-dehydrorhamnose 3,5-epimerase [Bacteroidales bacterium]|nr:dTDP-4-dehydrorhamnose 3,5-epimerase [Bacteroidales bacterium]
MRIAKTNIPDLLTIEPNIYEDGRGYFFESYSASKLNEQGGDITFVQDNESKSSYGVIRGLHYQLSPYAQTKLVRVISGKILDVVVDIRQGSPTFGKHISIELSSENKMQLLVPKGFAHGFSVLSETTIVLYKCDNYYNPASERGICYNDPALGIDWRIEPDKAIVSSKDKVYPALANAEMNFIYGNTH